MSYKYEASIKEAINIEYHTDFSGFMNRIKEIDHVYAQAAKADEYEAKAKAYDDIRYAMEMQTAIGVSDEDTLIDIEHVIVSLIERMGSGESDD